VIEILHRKELVWDRVGVFVALSGIGLQNQAEHGLDSVKCNSKDFNVYHPTQRFYRVPPRTRHLLPTNAILINIDLNVNA